MSTPPNPTTGAAQVAPSRERILDAAEALMATRGFPGTSITAISAESGSPASSIYWHFGSKEGLLTAVLERTAGRWLDGLGRARDLPGSADDRLGAFVTRGLRDLERRPPEFLRLAMMLGLERSATHPDGDCIQGIRRIRARGGALLAEAIEEAYADAGSETAREIAQACTDFAMVFIDGAFVAHEIHPSNTNLDRLASQLDTALRALAAEALERRTEGSACAGAL